MGNMFEVRSARALAATALNRAFPRACRLRRRRPTPSRLPARTSPRIACALPSTRQHAHAFNQPLSFDTSKVTDMSYMFYVRSARALAPTASSRAFHEHAACAAAASRPPASQPAPRPASHAPPFDSADRVGVQSVAEL